MTADLPPVPFAIGMASANGSPPFPLISFDDGAAVALQAILPLAAELGIALPHGGLFDLLRSWDDTLPALAQLVQLLAYDDRAKGHRGQFHPQELFRAELLLPEARQMFLLGEDRIHCLPVTVQGGADSVLTLDTTLRAATPVFALAAIIGKRCYGPDPTSPIAGWSLAATFAARDPIQSPGTLILGPALLPAPFADLAGVEYVFALMGRPISSSPLAALGTRIEQAVQRLARHTLLLPGDVIAATLPPGPDTPEAGHIDVMEATAPGFGRLNVSLQ